MEIKTDIIGEVFVPVLYSPSPHQSSEWKKKKMTSYYPIQLRSHVNLYIVILSLHTFPSNCMY